MSGLAESLEKRLQIGEASSRPLSTMSTPPVTYRRSSITDSSRRQKNHRDSGIGSDSGTAILTAASLSDSDSAASHRKGLFKYIELIHPPFLMRIIYCLK